MSTLTSCNSYYPGHISCNLFTECLYQNCPVCVDCIALSGCSVLSSILSTQTSFNSYYPGDISCNLFAVYLFQRQTCLHYFLALSSCSLLSTILSTQTILLILTISIDFIWMSCLERLPYLHWLYFFEWLFCIIDYLVYTDFV